MKAQEQRPEPTPGCEEFGDGDALQARAAERLTEEYPGRRRRRGEPEFREVKRGVHAVRWLAGAVGTLAAMAVGLSTLSEYLPITRVAAQEAHAVLDGRISRLERDRDEMKGDIKEIKSGQARTLALQLRQECRALQDEIAKVPPGQTRELLERQRDEIDFELGSGNGCK